MFLLLISFQGIFQHFNHTILDVGGFEHLDSFFMAHQRMQEIVGRTDVEREVGVAIARCQLALRMVQRQAAQVFGRIVVGTDYDVGQRDIDSIDAEILREIILGREVVRHLKGLVGQFQHGHAVVEGIDAHLVLIVQGQQIPALIEALQDVRADGLLVALVSVKLVIAHAQTVVLLHGANDGLQELLTRWRTLQNDATADRSTVRQCRADSQRGEHPTLDRVIIDHLGIGNIVFVCLRLTVDNDAEHVEDGVLVAIERSAVEGFAAYHIVLHPQVVNLFEREPLVLAQRIDEPDVLLEILAGFISLYS